MDEDLGQNVRLLASAYGTDPGLGLDPVIDVIIGRSSLSAVPSDRLASLIRYQFGSLQSWL